MIRTALFTPGGSESLHEFQTANQRIQKEKEEVYTGIKNAKGNDTRGG